MLKSGLEWLGLLIVFFVCYVLYLMWKNHHNNHRY